jgi:hypothetical protein
MITLTATKLDLLGHVVFTIEVGQKVRAKTRDSLKAAKMLYALGVERPLEMVEHARDWGFVEILELSTRPKRPAERSGDQAQALTT